MNQPADARVEAIELISGSPSGVVECRRIEHFSAVAKDRFEQIGVRGVGPDESAGSEAARAWIS